MDSDEMDFVNHHLSSEQRLAYDEFKEERATMRNGNNKFMSTLFNSGALTALAAISFGFGTPSAFAQTDVSIKSEQVPVAEQRDTQEPVFRISKLNRESSPATVTEQGYSAADAASTPIKPAKIVQAPASSTVANGADAASTAQVFSPVTTPSPRAKSPESKTAINAMTASSSKRITEAAPHPLDRAIAMAKGGLDHIQANVRDYSAIMVKRERIDGVLGSPEYMQMKVRCPRTISGQQVPFSVYLKTLKPKKAAGREVVWVQGQNDNKLCAHETGLLGMKRFYLEPTGWIAMQNSRYPIFDAGIENLIIKLIQRAESAKTLNRSKVNYRDNAEIMKRKCSLIELVNEEHHESDEFHKAHVFIDQELGLPVRYVAFDWPKTPGGKPEIIEEYTYVRLKMNQGYTDIDFSAENPAYKFPRR
ncbi:DUF1571 domain-containing protein [bacterium]|nr:DUF1571 domain-containing protein [bacterium]